MRSSGALVAAGITISIAFLHVAETLHAMGGCAREAGRLGEAEICFRRALEIKEAKLRADHVDVAEIRLELGRCAEDAGGPAETG